MSICLGHTSYVELAQVKFYKNLPPYSHCVWQKSSATSPSFARKNWMPCDSLGCRDFGTAVFAGRIVFKKSSGANSNCQKSMLRKTWISAERCFHKSANMFMTMFCLFKGIGFPFTKPTRTFFKKKSSILTWCFRPVTLGHLFQHLGHFRRSLLMGITGGFS